MQAGLFVKRGVGKVHIFLIHALFGQGDCLAKALEMDDFALTQEADDVVDIRIVGEAENVVVGESGLLLCCDLVKTTFQLFMESSRSAMRSILFCRRSRTF